MKNKIKLVLIKFHLYDLIVRIVSTIKLRNEYFKDYKIYKKNFINNSLNNEKCNDYQSKYYISYLVHSIEKGMTNEKLRPFGSEKIFKIVNLLDNIANDCNCFEYNLGMSCLSKYIDIYEKNNWIDRKEYILVKEYLNNKKFELINVGAHKIYKNDYKCDVNFLELLKSRHSVRNFLDKKISDDDINKVLEMVMYTPSACNRQMCKIYYVESKENRDLILKYGQGFGNFNKNTLNVFLITFNVNANISIGERNQGWLNSGLLGMNFVNALHSIGIGSCFIQFGNSHFQEKDIKSKLCIPNNERIGIVIAAGYYTNEEVIPYSSRKSKELMYKKI